MADELISYFREAEVFSLRRRKREILFEANKLKSIKEEEVQGISLRVIEDGKLGFSSSMGKYEPAQIIERAKDTLKLGIPAYMEFPGESSFEKVDIYDEKVMNMEDGRLIDMGYEFIEKVREKFPQITLYIRIDRGEIEVEIKNTRGLRAGYKKSFMSFSAEGVIVRGEDILFVGDGEVSSSLPDIDLIYREVMLQLDRAKRNVEIKSGRYPVIFSPHGVLSCFIPPLISALNGKNVLKGSSPLSGRVGEVVFSREFTLIDDPLVPLRAGTRPFDDEGVSSRRKFLIERGEVKGFLLDIRTAKRLGEEGAGNASRTILTLPSPSPSSLAVEEGGDDMESMIKNIKEGVLVEEVMGASQGNVMGGEFSGNILLGYKIENGEVSGRVKDTMISGNIYEALKDIVPGKGRRWVGSNLVPPILCPSLSISSRG